MLTPEQKQKVLNAAADSLVLAVRMSPGITIEEAFAVLFAAIGIPADAFAAILKAVIESDEVAATADSEEGPVALFPVCDCGKCPGGVPPSAPKPNPQAN